MPKQIFLTFPHFLFHSFLDRFLSIWRLLLFYCLFLSLFGMSCKVPSTLYLQCILDVLIKNALISLGYLFHPIPSFIVK